MSEMTNKFLEYLLEIKIFTIFECSLMKTITALFYYDI